MAPSTRATKYPRIVDLPNRTMAVVRTVGDPNTVATGALQALYGAVYTLKFAGKKLGNDFKVEPLRARWPDAHLVPKDQWTGLWGLPIPDGTAILPQKVPDIEVAIETWTYGTVAEILHIGPYTTEGGTVEVLHAFIRDNGYVIAGVHEEEYLTRPTAKVQKTIIRYAIRRP